MAIGLFIASYMIYAVKSEDTAALNDRSALWLCHDCSTEFLQK